MVTSSPISRPLPRARLTPAMDDDDDLDCLLDDALADLEVSASSGEPTAGDDSGGDGVGDGDGDGVGEGDRDGDGDGDGDLDLDALLDDVAADVLDEAAIVESTPAPAAAAPIEQPVAPPPARIKSTRRRPPMAQLDALLPEELANEWRKLILADTRAQQPSALSKQRPLSRAYRAFENQAAGAAGGSGGNGVEADSSGSTEGAASELSDSGVPLGLGQETRSATEKLFEATLHKALGAARSDLSVSDLIARIGDGAMARLHELHSASLEAALAKRVQNDPDFHAQPERFPCVSVSSEHLSR